MNNRLLIIATILILFSWGCTNSRERYIKKTIGSELVIFVDSMTKVNNRELYYVEIEKPLKIVVYSDSTNCNACDIKFPLWKIRFRELTRENNNIGLIFIINTEEIEDMELNADAVKAPGLRLYDTKGVFKRKNDLFHERTFHVFLLDKENKVIIVGNPIENSNLYNLYKKAIEMYTDTDNKYNK